MAHTPGPWKARPAAGQVWLNGSSCYEVLEVLSQGGRNPDDITLIAAAPELLAALRRLVEYCDNHSDYDAIGEAVRVIDKAEGRGE